MSRRRLAVLALCGLAVAGVLLSRQGVAADAGAALLGPFFLPALVAFALVRPFLAWPVSLLSVAVGYVLGFPAGVPVVLGATLLTCLPPFLLAARVDGADGLLGRLARTGEAAVSVTGGYRGMTAARLSPAPADAVSYAAGLSGVSVRAFLVGTALGELPWAVGFVLLGASLDGRPALALATAEPPPALLVGAALAALALVAGPLVRALT
ncbi:MAG: TVP38/TMEM64 family protein [Haloarculaceae archaeon]